MCATAGQAGDGAFELAHAREITAAIGATINETWRAALCMKWQCVAALLAFDVQIATSLLPLGSVR